jgi:hypothetical protein
VRAVSVRGDDLADLSAGILGRGGVFTFRARGASMVPFVQDGDQLTVQPTEVATQRVGDVILYWAGGERLVAHRVVGRRLDGDRPLLVTRGDATTGPGDVVEAEQVLGRVVQVQRGDGTLDLERGMWYTAARLWVATAPLGPLLLRGAGVLLRGSKKVARFLARLLGRL